MPSHDVKTRPRDLIWCYIGYFLNFGANLIVLPAIIKYLSREELGLWYIFFSISSMIQLLDLGFSPVIMRNVTYVWRGTLRLRSEGFVDDAAVAGRYSPQLMEKLLRVADRLYLIICGAMLLVMLVAGGSYVAYAGRSLPLKSYIYAYGVYALGSVGIIYWGRWINYMEAVGHIAGAQKILSTIKVLYIVFVYAGLFLSARLSYDGRLLVVSAGFALSSLLPRICVKRRFFGIVFPEGRPEVRMRAREFVVFWKTLWFNAWRQGMSTVSRVLTVQSLMFLLPLFFDLTVCAQYGLSLQLLMVAASMGRVVLTASYPAFNAARAAKQTEQLRDLFSLVAVVTLIVMISGSLVIVLWGNWVLVKFGIAKQLLPMGALALLALNTVLDRNMEHCCIIITTGNRVPFVPAHMAAMILIYLGLLGAALAGVRDMAVMIGIVLAIQMCWNYWRWPYELCREFALTPFGVARRGFAGIAGLLRGRGLNAGCGN